MFAVVVAFDPSGLESFSLPKLAALWLLAGLATAWWVLPRSRQDIPPASLWWRLGAFVVAMGAATVTSQTPALSLFGVRGRYDGLLPTLLYAGTAALVVILFWRAPLALRWVAIAIAAGAVACAVYVVLQAAHLDPVRWGTSGAPLRQIRDAHAHDPVGTIGHKDFVGGQLAIAMPLVIGVAFGITRRRPLVVVAGVTVLAAGLWLSHARGGMLASVAGVLAMAFAARDRPPRWLRGFALAFVLATVVAAGVVAWQRDFLDWRAHRSPVAGVTERELLDPGTLVARTYLWQAAWRTFVSRPVLGTGPDTFYANYTRHRVDADGGFNGEQLTDEPHDIYLARAAGTGVVGLLAYLLVVLPVLRQGYRRVRRAEGYERALLAAFLGGLVAYLVQGLVSVDVPPLALGGWVLVGAVAALADPRLLHARSEPAPLEPARGASKRLVTPAAVTAAAAALVLVAGRPVLGNHRARDGYEAMRRGAPYELARRGIQRAIDLDPREAEYRQLAGTNAERAGRYVVADGHYREALRLAPHNPVYLITRARAATARAEEGGLGDFPAADRAWRAAADADPTDYQLHEQYASMLNAWANRAGGDPTLRRRTVAHLERALGLHPDRADTWVSLAKVELALGDEAKARRAIAEALRIDPRHREAAQLRAGL